MIKLSSLILALDNVRRHRLKLSWLYCVLQISNCKGFSTQRFELTARSLRIKLTCRLKRCVTAKPNSFDLAVKRFGYPQPRMFNPKATLSTTERRLRIPSHLIYDVQEPWVKLPFHPLPN